MRCLHCERAGRTYRQALFTFIFIRHHISPPSPLFSSEKEVEEKDLKEKEPKEEDVVEDDDEDDNGSVSLLPPAFRVMGALIELLFAP